ncbi:MAG: RNA polymerase sigma factor [Acidobacteriota bacterium]|nr:RNA polymerase sigma factor [Acidobacteriota bacterium]
MTDKTGQPTASEPAAEAIPKLLELYGDKIHALGLRLCGGPEEAEDIVQETFMNAFRHWEQFEGRAQPSTWLFTIASRACQRMRRKRSGEPKRIESLENLLPAGTDSLPDPASLSNDPVEVVERRELEKVVHQAISGLPMRFRLPLVLKDLAEFKISEIAEILGVKEATVKTRIHRARLTLRDTLSGALPGPKESSEHPSRQFCLDLLHSKQEALDRGVDFPLAEEAFCSRCEAVFATLDLLKETCTCLGRGKVPDEVREALKREFTAREAEEAM